MPANKPIAATGTSEGIQKHKSSSSTWGKAAEETRPDLITKTLFFIIFFKKKKKDSLVLPQRQAHVLLHLLQAVVVRVDEVEGQGARQGTAPPSRGDPQKPAGGSELLISEGIP